ncbi:carboxypeptidase-like regulatory domain-containing protein [Winogradskyella bathintestinalis]|uniref:Carboxypeptidase-like regulatory domain-containing protein n=1 Tax=Winogradskyella bathintestinalis TaxID=3035208 RepID=A0ABT7ZUN9_9FLAO|nr:carboxypeptidase-like regulatory domain-containing protein [Winogradskyella bathintestinalis]MDN3492723.1 carboxypeptidase-like regulatory domain-containing protein [Winogradskyella bathintestinalis]
MKSLLLCAIFFFSLFGFSQENIKSVLFDESTNTPLPYATILLFPSKKYAITNSDGTFEIKEKTPIDSIEISYIGYNTKSFSYSYLKGNKNIFLSPKPYELTEVTITSKIDKDYLFNILSQVIKKYRSNDNILESKSYYSLISSYENGPLEHVAAFYNSKLNLSDGVTELLVKSGRFGQNKQFSFYSLNNTDILKDFKLFNKSRQMLPNYPGNMSFSSIRRNYNLKSEMCNYCDEGDLLVSFKPKKTDDHLFSGTILFNKSRLVIKKIELTSSNPEISKLSSIVENQKIEFKNINLNILFNPIDLNKIQHFEFEFKIEYHKNYNTSLITSNGLLYFYDYGSKFTAPYFTEKINFNNDYDTFIALQSTNQFWELNNPFPKTEKEKKSIEYFKNHGYLINYDNKIPKNYIKLINPSIIEWKQDERLSWADINQIEGNEYGKSRQNEVLSRGTLNVTKVTAHDAPKSKKTLLKFSYVLDAFKNKNNENEFIITTVFDRKSSLYNNNRTKNKLVYINIMFDIYEYYKQEITNKITSQTSYDDVKNLCEKQYKEAEKAIKRLNNDTNLGNDYQNLIGWNSSIKSKLNIDNYNLLKTVKNEK